MIMLRMYIISSVLVDTLSQPSKSPNLEQLDIYVVNLPIVASMQSLF